MTQLVLSAREFIAQNSTPAQILSMAKSSPDHAAELRAAAYEVASLSGVRLVARNDNRPTKKRRRAA